MYLKAILRSIGGFFGSFSSNTSFIFSFISSFFLVSSFIFF
ncbi:putative membrane protein [Helicobacter pylori SouthAfrica50]|uniref:Putative membrane protein n=1 Tax=Helicobacter pylori SouthAfrica50 TaxID=1352357 RepID=T2SA16_HELPX|nr:putative membrane protein [Helicobacter pylori SouthAfrica50]